MAETARWRPRPWIAAAPITMAGVAALLYHTGGRTMADFAMPLYTAALVLGPSVVYPPLRRGGVSAARAAIAAVFWPAVWVAKECYAIARVFRTGEALYYAVNPLAVGLFIAAALQIAVVELVIERRRHRRWRLMSMPGVVIAGIVALGVVYALIARRYGVAVIFDSYVALHAQLFAHGG